MSRSYSTTVSLIKIPLAWAGLQATIYIKSCTDNEQPVPKDAERHWDVNLILCTMSKAWAHPISVS